MGSNKMFSAKLIKEILILKQPLSLPFIELKGSPNICLKVESGAPIYIHPRLCRFLPRQNSDFNI